MEPDPAGGDGRDRLPAEHQRPLVDGGRQLTLIDELRRICGDENVVTEYHALRTYESDGLLQYAALPRGRRAVGGARLGQRPVRRGAAARGRGARGALAAAPDSRGRPREPARRV